MDETSLIQQRQDEALAILTKEQFVAVEVMKLWQTFKDKYFLHESPATIALHTKAILQAQHFPLVLIMPHHSQGGTEVFIYMPHCDERFTIATTVLTNHHVTIQEAIISTCINQFDMDMYIILDEHNEALNEQQRIKGIAADLVKHLTQPQQIPSIIPKRISKTLAHFNVKTKISYHDAPTQPHTQLFLITNDRPGLLATISQVFLKLNIHLHNAKIVTAGERVEDTFYISTKEGLVLSNNDKELLTSQLNQLLA